MSNNTLSKDEFEALDQVSKAPRNLQPSACVSRNAKRLVGIKLLTPRRDGTYGLTDKGREAIFVKQCIDGLRAMSNDASTVLQDDVANYLGRKGHIAKNAAGQFEITAKGRESIADILRNL